MASTVVSAQNTMYNDTKYRETSSTYDDRLTQTADLFNASRLVMRRNPALVSWISATDSAEICRKSAEICDKSAPNLREKSIISASYMNETEGENYLFYNGNHTNAANIMAGGEMNVANIGVLYGRASYAREKQRGIYQNYITRPELYYPYLVGDTTGTGNAHNERYSLSGGLSIPMKSLRLGIGAYYEGVATSKTEQPRRSSYSYLFRLSFALAKTTNRYILAAKLYPEIAHQTLNVQSSLLTYRFMQYYSFGQWNRKESTSGYSYARNAKILGAGTEITGRLLPQNDGWDALITLAYCYRWMQTEETSFKNLYASRTHHLSHSIVASRKLTDNLWLTIMDDGEINIRKGEEGVYQSQLQDEELRLYDDVEIGKNKLYQLTTANENLQARLAMSIAPSRKIYVDAATSYRRWHETYKMPDLHSTTNAIIPGMKLGYKGETSKNDIEVNVGFSCVSTFGNEYNVTDESTISQAENLKTQSSNLNSQTAQALIPYLVRTENNWLLQSVLYFSHKLSARRSCGFKLSGAYTKQKQSYINFSIHYLF